MSLSDFAIRLILIASTSMVTVSYAACAILIISYVSYALLSNLHVFINFYIWHDFRLYKTITRIIQSILIYFSFKFLKFNHLPHWLYYLSPPPTAFESFDLNFFIFLKPWELFTYSFLYYVLPSIILVPSWDTFYP